MLYAIFAALLAGAFLYALHYGYKLAFWYDDPHDCPHAYEEDDQTLAVRPVWDPPLPGLRKNPLRRFPSPPMMV